MIVIIAAVSGAKDATTIVITLVITSNILFYMEIKRDVGHPWQCKGCDDDSCQGTSTDAKD